jgi:hypothetical protein
MVRVSGRESAKRQKAHAQNRANKYRQRSQRALYAPRSRTAAAHETKVPEADIRDPPGEGVERDERGRSAFSRADVREERLPALDVACKGGKDSLVVWRFFLKVKASVW